MPPVESSCHFELDSGSLKDLPYGLLSTVYVTDNARNHLERRHVFGNGSH